MRGLAGRTAVPGPSTAPVASVTLVALAVLAVLAFLVSVGVAPVGSSGGLGPETAWAGTPGHTGSAGCGKRPVPSPLATATATGDLVQSLTVGGVTRSYRLAVPTHYRSSVATPLILLFHGSGSNAVQTSIYTQMPTRASRDGYLVATPDAVGGQWQLSPRGPGPPTWATPRH